ncbi:hypothetical protein GOV14_02765 [Candidatus Pacearchaeota archaeon]|nr:hypothetical protein [Candidatus Pacearchaeota archaeon]
MLKRLRRKSTKENFPHQNLSVRERTYSGEEIDADLYHLGVGDTVRVCFHYLPGASEEKHFEWHNTTYWGHKFGRDSFIINSYPELKEFSGSREKMRVMQTGMPGDYFIILDENDVKIREFSEGKKKRGHEKRRDLIRRAFENTPTCDYM